ncbi:hypothetical protein [Glycomyces terrestris]|uniref:RHIM domain-containing protein n=1 Tax=Glycomyces terrestris TaxID=2493553 RepID=A0A426UUW7_9ACTN|nr:hypothetical protein [Glycomyces terrestris]RRR98104.1 hypothetical protein EIW28_14370 [Glycomyces terrestris]
MTGVELILTALAAGAAAGAGLGAKEAVSTLITDTYQGLKTLLRTKLGDRLEANAVIDADHTEAETLRSTLAFALIESGAADDQTILEKARELLAQLEEPAGKYVVDNRGAKGILIGDHSNQTNHFN